MKLDLTAGTWADAEALVGKEIATLTGADPVNEVMIRHHLEALEWDFPPGYDADAAINAGYQSVVAPMSMYMTFGMPAYWQPGDPPVAPGSVAPFAFSRVPAPGSAMFATDTDVRFEAPMKTGDRLVSSWKLAGLTRKRLRVGDGAFFDFDITYRNQDGEVVACERTSVFRYEPVEAAPFRAETAEATTAADPDRSANPPDPGNTADGAQVRGAAATDPASRSDTPCSTVDDPRALAMGVGRTDSVVVGTRLPTVRLDLTIQKLAMVAAANRDFAPIHHDAEVARLTGAPTAYANMMFIMAFMERGLLQWAGPSARLTRLAGLRMRSFTCAGDTVTFAGNVAAIEPSGLLTVQVELRTGVGQVTATSRAHLQL